MNSAYYSTIQQPVIAYECIWFEVLMGVKFYWILKRWIRCI